MGKKDKEFAEKFGKIMSHYVRGMISSDELVDESMQVLSELESEMSEYSISRAWNVIRSIYKGEV
jgi:hypothetical protein